MTIKLIVGLANPGAEYAATRHNAGAWYVDLLAERLRAPLREEPKFFGYTSRINLAGADVRLLVPCMSDSRLVTWCVRSFYDELLAAGVKIHEYGPRMLHSKALLVDDHLAIIGSANFDHRSFRLNFEASLLIDDHDIAAQLDSLLDHEFRQSSPVTSARPRPLLTARLPEAIARLFAPLL